MTTLRQALEDAIFANPEDLATHAAYADVLQDEGDPRGEFVQVQLALEDATCAGERRRHLQAREKELLAAHERDWLGQLASFILDDEPSGYQVRNKLKHLHLHGSDLGDEGCADLVESGILRRLETLDLRFGCISDDGARTLAACPEIRNLRYLSLANNELTEAGEDLLSGLGINVRLDEQNEVGSDEYLLTGDME